MAVDNNHEIYNYQASLEGSLASYNIIYIADVCTKLVNHSHAHTRQMARETRMQRREHIYN